MFSGPFSMLQPVLEKMILGRKLTGKTMKFLLFMFVGVVHLLPLASGKAIYGNGPSHRTFQEIKEEIAHYGDVAKSIINLTVYGKAQNRSYERLALLVDTVGPRLSGSKNLERAIEIMQQNLKGDGLENVHLEPVKIPHWERGEESAVMLEPRIHKMAILGLGSSIGTPPEGITAEVLVVTSFDELQRRGPDAEGKIVVYNQPYTNYSAAVQYRMEGAVEAAKVGALASLIRSVASFSIYRFMHCRRKWQPTPVFLPGECQGRGSLVGCRLWGHTESDTTEATLQQQQQIQRLLLQSFVFNLFLFTFLLCHADVEECVPTEFSPGKCVSVGLQGLRGRLFGRSLHSVCGGWATENCKLLAHCILPTSSVLAKGRPALASQSAGNSFIAQ
ncbi:carboxypeptidase Q isoform X5 [Bos javanicus]|uniref:carboxypeptidase Q isoform X5 n=1 Tax=Bos javanicus TaxID=9906 RepID=UPI002AA8831E|nr:carboxypeptidase Q isoform X5 [Bos javanicus]